jgi:hypothetical protein
VQQRRSTQGHKIASPGKFPARNAMEFGIKGREECI